MDYNYTDIFPLLSAIFVFVIGLFVLLKNKKSRINLTFFLHALAIALWLFTTFMMFISRENREQAIFWDRAVYASVVFIPIFMYHFGLAYMNKKRDFLLYLGYALSVIFLLLVPTKYFVNDIFIYKWGVHTKAQLFHHIFLVYFVSYVIIWFIKIFFYYKKLKSPLLKEQTKYIILGFLFLFTIGPVAYLPAYGIGIYPFAYVSGVIFSAIIAYAIVRHRLMDIKLVFRRSTVFALSLFLILIPAFVAKYFLEKYLGSVSVWLDLIILIIGVVSYPFARDYSFKIANKYFFSSLYDGQQVIAEVSDRLRMIMDIKKVYDFIYSVLLKTFHTKTFAVISYNKERKEYAIQYNKGIKIKKNNVFDGNDFLHRYFTEQNKAIVVEEVKKMYYNNKTKKTIDLLIELNISILAPLNVKNKTIGLLVLGPKESGDMYNDEDFQVLEIIGAQAAVSIENAQLYSEVKEFNEKLEEKVENATIELRSTNSELKDMNEKLVTAYEKLHQLDRAKTEFISIASHQLRTPLTSIKGFISLLLDGTYGEIHKVTREVLEKVFISNERLIKLVEDLLNISRIESGKLVFRFNKDDITELVKDMVDSFELAAKNKKLKLEYRSPKKKIPEIYFDHDKMREIISNLIDNSIKYTKKGSVSVTVESDKDFVRIVVSDSGMGIVKEEVRYIFEKFQRGKDSSTTHTEGIGLGLYVCEKMLSLHKGKIWAESEGLGKGSKFIIQLKRDFVPEDMIKTIGKEKRN